MYAEKARKWNSKKRSQKMVKEVNAENGMPSVRSKRCWVLCGSSMGCCGSSIGCCGSSTCSPHPPANSGGYGCSSSPCHYGGYADNCSGLKVKILDTPLNHHILFLWVLLPSKM